MSIQYRIVESAPLPVKEKKQRKIREKRDFSSVPVGGAAAFPVGDADPKKLKASIYQSAANFKKSNPDFRFKVSIEKNEETGATEIWVRRLAAPGGTGGSPVMAGEGWGGLGEPAVTAEGNGGAQGNAGDEVGFAATDTAETVTNGFYDYSQAAAE